MNFFFLKTQTRVTLHTGGNKRYFMKSFTCFQNGMRARRFEKDKAFDKSMTKRQ
jgi:hypothetical protein